MIGYIKAEINEKAKAVDVDINTPTKHVALAIAAAIAAEIIDNRADYNQYMKMVKNVVKANEKRDSNETKEAN